MTVLLSLTLALLAGYSVLMMAYALGWARQPLAPEAKGPSTDISISVIVPARNEAAHIAACLRSIRENGYGPLEIIVIDDFSEDDTALLAQQALEGCRGHVLRLRDFLGPDERLNAYKKKALEIAIDRSAGDWIVTTDADCVLPKDWLAQLAAAMAHPEAKFLAAPVTFVPPSGKKDLLYYFQSLDFMTMQGITAASDYLDLGNMCNGANLAFEKEAYRAVEGYKGIDHLASGDDLLLMHKIRSRYPKGIRYIKSPAAIAATPAQPSWVDFIQQRVRWSSKTGKYDDTRLTLVLLLVYLFNLSLFCLFITGFFTNMYWLYLLGIVFVKISFEFLFLIPVARFYGKSRELWRFPFLQPLHIFYIVIAGFLGKTGTYKWKGRSVK